MTTPSSPRPRHPLGAQGSSLTEPLVDSTEVVRSPNAASARLTMGASPFHNHNGTQSLDATARLRSNATVQDSPTRALPYYQNPVYNHASMPSHPYPELTINTSRLDSSKPMSTPLSVKIRSLQWPTVKYAIVIAAVLILSMLYVTRQLTKTEAQTIDGNMAACEPLYPTIEPHLHQHAHGVHHDPSEIPVHGHIAIAIVTMHDSRKVPMPRELSYMTGIEEGSNVDVLDVVWKNRRDYAERHGYTLIDGSEFLKTERPPAWYKLKVVESVLDEYDWVFYLDADAWITNPDIKLETLLPAKSTVNLVITEDATGVNAGAWILRNSDWSRSFLKEWWSMDSFIRPFGDHKSGDNDALKDIVKRMTPAERAQRLAIPMQCAFNSYLWRPSMRQWMRLFSQGNKVRQGIWRPGHLLVHLAGWEPYKALKRLQRLFLTSNGSGTRKSQTMPLPRLSRKLFISDAAQAALGIPMPSSQYREDHHSLGPAQSATSSSLHVLEQDGAARGHAVDPASDNGRAAWGDSLSSHGDSHKSAHSSSSHKHSHKHHPPQQNPPEANRKETELSWQQRVHPRHLRQKAPDGKHYIFTPAGHVAVPALQTIGADPQLPHSGQNGRASNDERAGDSGGVLSQADIAADAARDREIERGPQWHLELDDRGDGSIGVDDSYEEHDEYYDEGWSDPDPYHSSHHGHHHHSGNDHIGHHHSGGDEPDHPSHHGSHHRHHHHSGDDHIGHHHSGSDEPDHPSRHSHHHRHRHDSGDGEHEHGDPDQPSHRSSHHKHHHEPSEVGSHPSHHSSHEHRGHHGSDGEEQASGHEEPRSHHDSGMGVFKQLQAKRWWSSDDVQHQQPSPHSHHRAHGHGHDKQHHTPELDKDALGVGIGEPFDSVGEKQHTGHHAPGGPHVWHHHHPHGIQADDVPAAGEAGEDLNEDPKKRTERLVKLGRRMIEHE